MAVLLHTTYSYYYYQEVGTAFRKRIRIDVMIIGAVVYTNPSPTAIGSHKEPP